MMMIGFFSVPTGNAFPIAHTQTMQNSNGFKFSSFKSLPDAESALVNSAGSELQKIRDLDFTNYALSKIIPESLISGYSSLGNLSQMVDGIIKPINTVLQVAELAGKTVNYFTENHKRILANTQDMQLLLKSSEGRLSLIVGNIELPINQSIQHKLHEIYLCDQNIIDLNTGINYGEIVIKGIQTKFTSKFADWFTGSSENNKKALLLLRKNLQVAKDKKNSLIAELNQLTKSSKLEEQAERALKVRLHEEILESHKQLIQSNQRLQETNAELYSANTELKRSHDKLSTISNDLSSSNKELLKGNLELNKTLDKQNKAQQVANTRLARNNRELGAQTIVNSRLAKEQQQNSQVLLNTQQEFQKQNLTNLINSIDKSLDSINQIAKLPETVFQSFKKTIKRYWWWLMLLLIAIAIFIIKQFAWLLEYAVAFIKFAYVNFINMFIGFGFFFGKVSFHFFLQYTLIPIIFIIVGICLLELYWNLNKEKNLKQ